MSEPAQEIVPVPATPERRIGRFGLGFFCIANGATVLIAIANAPVESLAATIGTALIATALMRRRYTAILTAAENVSNAFLFTDRNLTEALRELAKQTLLWTAK